MDNKKSVGLIIIGVFEILIGLFGIWNLYLLLTFEKRTGSTAGLGWLFLPLLLAAALLFLLGIGIVLRAKLAWYFHVIGIPLTIGALVLLFIYWGMGFTDLDFWMLIAFPAIVAILLVWYLILPGIREQFWVKGDVAGRERPNTGEIER
ncbi:MAG: hypothetical protein V1883_00560 [Candidatus Omnitrophota bacterium]